ncbi:MAG: tetratricopeptide repeat protein [Alistipes sp.]|nr:tetratricopeptide repeat protein [Candidatus Alistipes equi]
MPNRQSVSRERVQTLFDQHRYADSRHALLEYERMLTGNDVEQRIYVAYMRASIAMLLGEKGAKEEMVNFIKCYPQSIYVNDVRFHLGVYYCDNGKYDLSKQELDKVVYSALSSSQKAIYDIRLGYDEFVIGNFNVAYDHFERISPMSEFYNHSIYYKAYINYSRGRYDDALRDFSQLSDTEEYKELIPYYILQIKFAKKDYQYVTKQGEQLVEGTAAERRPSILRIVAESYFRTDNFQKAKMRMLEYKRAGGNMGREENYLLGYSAYRTTDYSTAIEAFRQVPGPDDELTQNSSYHLADCYLKRNDMKNAISSFAIAASGKFSKEIQEDAMLNYGKLLFETNGGNFNESINVLSKYIETYPDSKHVSEVRELLVAAYYNSKQYDMAYNAIKQIPSPNNSIKVALQKITFFNGCNALKSSDTEAAARLLLEAKQMSVSPKYNALSAYALANVLFERKDYKGAVDNFNYYLKRAPKTAEEYTFSLYGLGYAYYELGELERSKKAFEGFVWKHKTKDGYRADALNRLGDIDYVSKNYASSEKRYAEAQSLMQPSRFYSLYHRALCLGLQMKMDEKVELLKSAEPVKNDYDDRICYELGRTYIHMQRYSDAIPALERFTQTYPESELYNAALLNLGLSFHNVGQRDKSLQCYDSVIRRAPQSEAAKDAIQSIREIYVYEGKADEYFAYASSVSAEGDLTALAKDSISFKAAQSIYLQKKYSEARDYMTAYLRDYPKGYYTDDALFLLSDACLRVNRNDEAMDNLRLLVQRPRSRYSYPATKELAVMTAQRNLADESASLYRKLYELSSDSSERAEAVTGYVESTFATQDDYKILAMAENVEKMTDVPDKIMRRTKFQKAKVLTKLGREDVALVIYSELSSNLQDREGAESMYKVLQMLFRIGRFDECEKKIYAFADSKTPQSYWLGRAFILLGDIFNKRGDAFQARATYQSIVDGYTPATDGIVDEAKDRIAQISQAK